MNINLREEETDTYLSFYQSYLDEIQQLNKKVTDVLNEVMQQSKYDKLQQRISGIIDAYTDTIAGHISVFTAWEESEGSLRACLRTYRAGDAADEVCARIERQMSGRMQDTLMIEKADMVVTERPVVSEDGLDQLENICRYAHEQVQDITADYLSQAAGRGGDNEIYGTLRPLLKGVSADMAAFFEASLHSFIELHDFVKDLSAGLHNMADENGTAPGRESNAAGGVRHHSNAPGADDEGDMDSGGENFNEESFDEESFDEESFDGENFNEENISLAVRAVESIVNQAGADALNTSVEQHYQALTDSRRRYARRAAAGPVSEADATANIYGRYTVTPRSIRMTAPAYAQVHAVLEPIDQFYKEKFEALGSRYDQANKIIHGISSFLTLWGLGTWNLSKLFSDKDSDKSILEKISLGGVALSSCTKAVMLMNGGAHFLKILDWAMPYLKKSRVLVRLNEKVWNLTRHDIQIPYIHKRMDLYMMEHYEIKYGMEAGKSSVFTYYHSAAAAMDNEQHRRAFEDCIFAAEITFTPQNYDIQADDPVKNREIRCGIFLNLIRSGMCSRKDLESGTANEIVDRLYDIYTTKENITPRVKISPDQRRIA